MPIIDRLLFKSFLGPFVLTLLMAWFVLLLQFLWFFLEKIAGKGLATGYLLELLAYRAVGLLPLALPIAVLVASVMVIGGLAEHYEWSALQSAGVSPGRMLRALGVVGLLTAGASHLLSDYLIPVANAQFFNRLTAIHQKKPSLHLEAGVFTDDLDKFSFYAAGGSPDGQTLYDVLLYDERGPQGQLNQVTAKSGVFQQVQPADKVLYLTLSDGEHLQEVAASGGTSRLLRTTFATHTLAFDLRQFDLQRNANLAPKNHQALLPSWALQAAADSLAQLPAVPPPLATARAIKRQRLLFEKHRKLSLAAICLPFVLLGGMTGTIVRKGGFGYPVLVSIIAFVVYLLLLEGGSGLVKAGAMTGRVAGWAPCCLLSVLAIGLMIKRSNIST